jgi:osmotically-inducible protein OsmY
VESADTLLRRAVLARLIANPSVSTGHIGVMAIAGHVTLSGYVTSHAQKEAARAATRRVKGVGEVADEVRVAVPRLDVAEPKAEHPETQPLTASARQ